MPVIGAYIPMGVEGPHEIIGVHRGRGATLRLSASCWNYTTEVSGG